MIIQGVTLKGITVSDSSFNSNGALLYVDAGNTASYPGTGTTWTGLSSNSHNATLVGSPGFTSAGASSYFTFNGLGSNYASTTASKFNVTYTGKTVFIAARITAVVATAFRCMFGTNGGTRNFNIYIYSPSTGVYQMHYSAYNAGGFSNNLSLTAGQWAIFAVTHTTAGLVTYYHNGVAVGTNTGITFAQYSSNNGEYIGLGDNYWYGDIALCAVYGRALSSDEILQNYNAIKDRFVYIQSNLQLYFNPENSLSYAGSGTTVTDLSSSGLTGTMTNITYTSPYFTYNGSSSRVSIADNALLEPGTGDFTLEAWVYYSAITGSTRTFISKTDNGGLAASWSYGFRTQPNGAIGEIYMEVGNGTTSVATPRYNVSTGQWYHIVGVWTNVASNSIELFVNGVSQGSNSHSFTSVKNSTNPLYLGSYNGGEYSQWFNGRIGIVRYYSKALSSAEVSVNFQGSKATYGL